MENLAKYGAAGVSIVAIYAIYWIVCKFLTFLKESEERHCKSYEKLNESLEKNTQVVGETKDFLSNLNGRFKKVVQDKLS